MNALLLKIGAGGATLAALCCATPLLPWVMGGVGLSGYVGYVYRDAVLLPVMALFLLIAGIARWRQRRMR